MDVFDEIHHNPQQVDDHIDSFFRDLEAMWGNSNAIYFDPLDTQETQTETQPKAPPPSPTDPIHSPFLTLPQFPTSSPRYLAPSSKSYARHIWDACGFRVGNPGERETTIERGLARWANRNQLMHLNKEGEPCITWSQNGTRITGRWSAFRLWFLCACTKVHSK